MKPIKPNQKVADVLKKHPQTFRVFREHGCPDMRNGFFSFTVKIMSVRNAARIHRIPVDQLLDDLQKAKESEENEM